VIRLPLIGLLLLAWPAALRAEVPGGLARLVVQHCARCHNESHNLDLSKPAEIKETATWLAVAKMVETSRMPPPDKAVAKRFPLDPAERKALMSALTDFLGDKLDGPVHTPYLSLDMWRVIATGLAAPVLSEEQIEEQIGKLYFGLFGDWVTALDELALVNASEALCGAVARADVRAPTDKRRYLVGLRTPSSATLARASAEPIVRKLFEAAYGTAPTAEELKSGTVLLARFRKESTSWTEAWQGLCATYLSGPRILYMTFDP
jgi:hypothetical protein